MAARSHHTLFRQLIGLHREAFDTRHYNTAYHLLAAAFHEADERDATKELTLVQRTAEEQLALIDRVSPEYEHSTASAAARGHQSLFTLLAHRAHARVLLHQHKGSPLGQHTGV